jgi:nucleoside-diphosphate-sugar epimerase
MSEKILVIGGTGMLGRPVALKLIEAGNEVFVLTRNIESAKSKLSANLNFVKGDVTSHLPLELISKRKTINASSN